MFGFQKLMDVCVCVWGGMLNMFIRDLVTLKCNMKFGPLMILVVLIPNNNAHISTVYWSSPLSGHLVHTK